MIQSNIIALPQGTFELVDNAECPFCRNELYRKLGTKIGKTRIDCLTCNATATGKDIEDCQLILEQVRDDIATSAVNAEYMASADYSQDRKRELQLR